MTTRPTPFQLVAWHQSHGGASSPHAADCPACAAYLRDLDRERAALLSRERPDDFARRLRGRVDEPDSSSGAWLPRLAGGLLAASLAVVVLVLSPAGGEPAPTAPQPLTVRPSTTPEPVRLKGADVRVAVVVLRDGAQQRHTRPVALLPGDRFRVEVTVAQRGTVGVGVRVDGGAWVEMMEPSLLDAGTHVLPKTMLVDSNPMKATVIAGPPAALAAVRAGGDAAGVASLSIETEVAR